jgi:nicotinate dehydrogenase subunit B
MTILGDQAMTHEELQAMTNDPAQAAASIGDEGMPSDGEGFFRAMDRRDFLKVTGGGLFLFFAIGDTSIFAQQRRELPTDFNAFLRISPDGRVTCFTGKIEMGQGIVTGLAQMLADELDVPVDSVEMVMGDTDRCPWDRGTFGSLSTRAFGPALRQAGAEARRALLELAAERLKVPADRLTVENGIVADRSDHNHSVSYADLTKGEPILRHATGKAVVKKPTEFRIMTRPMARRDAKAKVTGAARYAGDIRLPGMLYAKVLRPPSHASKFISADLTEARAVEGVRVVQEGDFIVVLHALPDQAEIALSKVKAKFDTPQTTLDDRTIFTHLLNVAPEGKTVAKQGDLQQGASAAASAVESTYYDGYVAHAPMEPHTALVSVEGEKATVWVSTQNPFTCKDEVAKELGIKPENVHVITPFVGGGFGGKTHNAQALDAARLSKITGKPVQVAYTRKEEFFFDFFRPAAVIKVKSGVTGEGKLCLWDYHVYFAGERGAQHFYDIPNSATTAYNASWVGAEGTHPFATGAWRAPGNNTNTFAREQQIDIMASKAGIDPVEFRIRNLTDERMKNVLRRAADAFGLKPMKAPSGRGIGVACGLDAGTYVASIAEVEADRSTGKIRVKRVVCAQDMGLAVNPEGAKIQMEGCITMGLGYALAEHVRFKGGEVLEENFDTYEIPRFSWLPQIETLIVDDKDAAPQGGGEPAIILMGALVANAVHDALGVRVVQLPITPERVLEALKNKG